MGVDQQTLGQNMLVLVSALILLVAGLVVLVALWTIARIVFHFLRQRHSWRAFIKAKHRADGEKFPPQGEGFCDGCGNYRTKLYFPPNAGDLCPECYDRFWRAEKAFSETNAVMPRGAVHSRPRPSDKTLDAVLPNTPR